MVAIHGSHTMVPPRSGKQAVRHFGAFRGPVYEHGPKLRDRNFGDGVGCKASIPFGRLLGPTTWPVLWQRRRDHEAQARRQGWSSSEFGRYRANAAGIDIGATEIYVAVPPDRDPNPVRSFP